MHGILFSKGFTFSATAFLNCWVRLGFLLEFISLTKALVFLGLEVIVRNAGIEHLISLFSIPDIRSISLF